jgi:hypothetical protein
MTDVSATIEQGGVQDDAAGSRWPTRLATALAVLAVFLAFAILRLGTSGDQRFHVGLDVGSIAPVMTTLLYPLVGALIVQRRPRTRVAWLMIAMGIGLGLGFAMYGYGAIGMPPPPTYPYAFEALVVSQFFMVPVLATCTTLLLLLFPTDTLLDRRWRWVAVLSFVGLIAFMFGSTFRPGPLDDSNFPDLANPLALSDGYTALCDSLVVVGNVAMLSAAALAAASLVLRYRRGDRVEQAQIRWIARCSARSSPWRSSSRPPSWAGSAKERGISRSSSCRVSRSRSVSPSRATGCTRSTGSSTAHSCTGR